MSVDIRFESSEMLVLTELGAIKVRSYERRVETDRWNLEYFNIVEGVPWEPNPGLGSEEIRGRYRPK